MPDLVTNLSSDALRLLYAIALYSQDPHGEGHRWLRRDSLDVVAHLGVKQGVFGNYDLAPSLFQYRGVKMFAMLSHEAGEDVDVLFRSQLVERILLNTWFYATLTGVRTTETGERLLRERISPEDKKAVDRIVRCGKCGSLLDFAVSLVQTPSVHLVMCRACNCHTGGHHREGDDWLSGCEDPGLRIEGFFGIGEVEYVASPFFIRETSNGK